tara:strand:+ start:7084 stop:7317 length:234 start_codon:yes stop_codon:yes gene_type:complete
VVKVETTLTRKGGDGGALRKKEEKGGFLSSVVVVVVCFFWVVGSWTLREPIIKRLFPPTVVKPLYPLLRETTSDAVV